MVEITRQAERDCFRSWPICAALAGPVLLRVLYAFWDDGAVGLGGSAGVLTVFAASAAWYGLAILATLWLPFLAMRARYRRLTSFATLPAVASVLLWWPPLLAPVDQGALHARFLVHRAGYQAEITRLEARSGVPVIACFPWRIYGFAGLEGEIAVVYDKSDEIVRPFGQQSPAWREHACSDLHPVPREKRINPFTTQHLDGHYYLADILFQ